MWWLEQNTFDYTTMNDFFNYYIETNSLSSICAFGMRRTMANFVE